MSQIISYPWSVRLRLTPTHLALFIVMTHRAQVLSVTTWSVAFRQNGEDTMTGFTLRLISAAHGQEYVCTTLMTARQKLLCSQGRNIMPTTP